MRARVAPVLVFGTIALGCAGVGDVQVNYGPVGSVDAAADVAPSDLGADVAIAGSDVPAGTDVVITPDAGSSADTTPTSSCAAQAAACRAVQKGCLVDATGKATCKQCPRGQAPLGDLATCGTIPGTALSHDFGTITLKPGEELNGWCQSWEINNPEELWVQTVEFRSDGGYHHSNWIIIPQGATLWTNPKTGQKEEYPAGLWKKCYSQGFHEVDAAIAGGVLYAQSTQIANEIQKFPDGVAVRVPPYSRVIAATHLLNILPNELATNLQLLFYTVPLADVKVKLTPFQLDFHDLQLPPKASSSFTASCDFRGPYDALGLDAPFAPKLYYALPHYHAMGTGFVLEIVGGVDHGKVLIDNSGYGPDPYGRLFDPPVDLSSADGLKFSCKYQNPTDKTIHFGVADGEMCMMLGFVESPTTFVSTVLSVDPKQTLVADGMTKFSGSCLAGAVPFPQDKPGGTPLPK